MTSLRHSSRRPFARLVARLLIVSLLASLTPAPSWASLNQPPASRASLPDSLAAASRPVVARVLVWVAVAPSVTKDDNGNLTTKDAEAIYVWDHENRLTRVAKTDGTVVEYVYDADGNRVQTRTTPAPIGGIPQPAVMTDYLVDTSGSLSHVMAEVDASTPTPTLQAMYIRGDDLLALMRPLVSAPAVAADWQSRFYHSDSIGSIRRLTNESGNITDGYTYSAFGELLGHSGTDPQPYAFAGEPLDPNSGFQYHRARWMDPRVGRFTGMDPWEGLQFEPPSLHRYTYTHADPANRVDPTGLFGEFSIGGLAASMAISGTINAIASYNPDAVYYGLASGFAEGAAEGAIFYGAGVLAVKLLWRAARAARMAAAIARIRNIPLVGFKSPIAPYNVLQSVTAGERGAIHAHHILEARHLQAWGFSALEIAGAPAQVLARAEHLAITRELLQRLPTRVVHTRAAVWQVYQEVYRDYPHYLRAIEHLFL